jgi:hypothetical protein
LSPYLHHVLSPTLLFGALGTIAIFSLVFKENKLFRLFEHVFIGLATGYAVQLNWTDTLRPLWWDPMVHQGQWGQIFVLPFCAMYYTVYSRRHAWMARLAFGILFGFVAGTAFQAFAGEYLPQIYASFKPISVAAPYHLTQVSKAVNNLVFIVILVCVSVYFFFAFEQKNPAVQKTALAGRWMLMIAFGATFGATIMTREALLIDRMRYLFLDWLQLDKFIK